MFTGLGTAALVAMTAFSGGHAPDHSAQMPNKNQCAVTLRIVVNHNGDEHVRISGQCAGHAPTANEVQRLTKPLAVPAWMHFYQKRPNHWIVCGGDCATSALIRSNGKAYTS
jgi:hypothetical protein